jgi:hypothetical protein
MKELGRLRGQPSLVFVFEEKVVRVRGREDAYQKNSPLAEDIQDFIARTSCPFMAVLPKTSPAFCAFECVTSTMLFSLQELICVCQ